MRVSMGKWATFGPAQRFRMLSLPDVRKPAGKMSERRLLLAVTAAIA